MTAEPSLTNGVQMESNIRKQKSPWHFRNNTQKESLSHTKRSPKQKQKQNAQFLASLCDPFGMVKWPFKWLSDLQLGDEKVTTWITLLAFFCGRFFFKHPLFLFPSGVTVSCVEISSTTHLFGGSRSGSHNLPANAGRVREPNKKWPV